MSAKVIDVAALGDIPAEIVGAVVTSIDNLDTSRRVAWAKMYAALARGEEAQRDLSRSREDAKLLSMLSGFAYGALEALLGHAENDRLFREYLPNGDLKNIKTFLPRGALVDGKDRAHRWIASLMEKIPEFDRYITKLRERAQAERDWLEHCRERNDALANDTDLRDLVFGSVRRSENQRLSHVYGFRSQDEMFQWLAQYKTASEQ